MHKSYLAIWLDFAAVTMIREYAVSILQCRFRKNCDPFLMKSVDS